MTSSRITEPQLKVTYTDHLIDISVKRNKNMFKDIVDLTKYETVEQIFSVFTVLLSNSGPKHSSTKNKEVQIWL